MDADKNAAYSTLYTVLKTYLQMLAPFLPFITEKLWQNLTEFSTEKVDSIHLTYRPIASELYISPDLMEEIAQVRKIIKLALFVRAKNKVAIKQPLQKLSVKMEKFTKKIESLPNGGDFLCRMKSIDIME